LSAVRRANSRARSPVGAGFVDSMARTGGNATGFVMLEYSTSSREIKLPHEQVFVAGTRE
jgi:hypothetical protein